MSRSTDYILAKNVSPLVILNKLFYIGQSSEPQSLISQGKKRTLEELFKPPLDIMFKGDWQSARDAATAAKKWLLVNIQDAGEFLCQTLNRDVWSNDAVKTIIREHFLFWQVKLQNYVSLV